MKPSLLSSLQNKTISLLGYGVSNRAVCKYLMKNNIYPTIRNNTEVNLPSGVSGIFGQGHENACEDVVFRSPSWRAKDKRVGQEVYTDISFFLDDISAFKIGVTGSDGKTTTTTLIYKMLLASGKVAHLGGNIGVPIASVYEKIKKEDFLCLELSSFQLFDYAPMLDIAIVTSLSQNHLDWHRDEDEYFLSKANIVKNAKKQIINYDISNRELFSGNNLAYFSVNNCESLLNNKNDFVYIKNGYIYYNKTRLFSIDGIKLRGKYNLYNILGATLALYDIVPLEKIKEVAYSYKGEPHRSEHISTQGGVFFVDSSADSTPTRTISTLSAYPKNRVIAIMGGYDKCLDYTPLKDACKELLGVILFGANRDKIARALTGTRKLILANDIYEATKIAYGLAKKGDYIILTPASASFDMFENYIDRAEKFKDAIRGLENGEN